MALPAWAFDCTPGNHTHIMSSTPQGRTNTLEGDSGLSPFDLFLLRRMHAQRVVLFVTTAQHVAISEIIKVAGSE